MDSLLAAHRRSKPLPSAFAISAVVHSMVVLALLTGQLAEKGASPLSADALIPSQLVWFAHDGPGGGGGGGGNRRAEPSRQMQMRGDDRTSTPAFQRAVSRTPEEIENAPPILLEVPIRTFADSDLMRAGVLEAAPFSPSQGPGDGGGVGPGNGPGMGPDHGPGLGPGEKGGVGSGPRGPGTGVRPPVPLHRENPQYTVEAMRARIEGFVRVECIVQTNGTCTNIRVARSLDQKFGLDQQALRAAALWRFAPGTLLGKPVPVLVTIQIGFSIH